jgi:RimJ/RimL family protein N-acetyltransferase
VTEMTDPSTAMISFQEALLAGALKPQPAALDRDLFIHADQELGVARFAYVKLKGRTVTAFVNLVRVEPIDGVPCFAIGCAVPEAYRGQGRAKDAVRAALAEMRHGFRRAGIPALYVEAVVGVDNLASQHVSAATISAKPTAITDNVSGLPAFHYQVDIMSPAFMSS